MRISQIWRYPVKSMQGEQLESAEVTEHGIHGDRGWGLVDLESGHTLTGRREPDLLFAHAAITEDDTVQITLPTGEKTSSDATQDGALLSEWIGRPVELQRATAVSAGTFDTQIDETETGDWFSWTGREGSFHDSTVSPISLVSTTSLGNWDVRRFRTNVVLDGAGEDELVGETLRLGSATLWVSKQIDRCVMVTRPQPQLGDSAALPRDLGVLKTVNAERASLLSIGCVVQAAGTIARGNELTIAPAE